MPPAGWGYSYLDHSTGYYGAILVLAALLKRRRTGQGCYIDLSQTEAGIMLSGTATLEAQVTGKPTDRHGNRMQAAVWVPHGAYPCHGTDEWIAIAIQTDEQWQAFAAEIGSPEWVRDPRFTHATGRKTNEDELDRLMAQFTKNEDRYELMDRLQKRGIAAGAVQKSVDRCERDAQLKARNYFVPLPHSEIGTWPIEGFPAKFSAMQVEVGGLPGRGAPVMGEDNDYVYGNILGLSSDEITALREDWII
jgi:crotonobetainyl-CoA:carnitine CoA-transferase CaiB-like acyl-CoA transferase